MPRRSKAVIYPGTLRKCKQVGRQIRLARLRRNLSISLVMERTGISRATLWKVENGDPSVAFGTYALVLNSIGLPDDILLLAADDEAGRALQDQKLLLKGKRNRE